MIRRLAGRFRRSERGAAMVEFAIVVLLLFTLLFGIIEFGWILNGYITLTGAARDGARIAVVRDSSDLGEIKQVVIDRAATFNLDPGDIGVNFGSFSGDPTIVTVDGELPLAVGFFPINNPFAISVEVSMKHEK